MLEGLLICVAIALVLYAFYKWATINNDFFEKHNLKSLKPKFLFGNTGGVFFNQYSGAEFCDMMYDAFPNELIYGMFHFREPQYVIRDPDTFKKIAIKDSDHFEDHFVFIDETTDRLWGKSLVFMKGERWRHMRATLSPAFTGSKMRQMFGLITECADEVVTHFSKKAANGEQINIEMKDFSTRYANDVIASCAFGLKTNSFEEPENEFYTNGKKLTDFVSFKTMMKSLIIATLPSVARALDLTFVDKRIANAFKDTILETMKVRKENNIHRPDMINIMMQVREGMLDDKNDDKKEKDGFATVQESVDVGKTTVSRSWSDDDIVSQCFIFFAAGFDSSALLLTFAAYELTVNPDIQQKLYEEIAATDRLNAGKNITYDGLQKLTYLDQFISEVLRKWPSAVFTDRVCTKDYAFDDGDKLKFTINKGAALMIPIYSLHRDPKYFPEPEKFDPERFNDENKGSIQAGTYIPFGIGGRACIGSRFALMEAKAILYKLLLNFSLEPNEKTQIPIKLKKFAFNLETEKGMHLELKIRKQL